MLQVGQNWEGGAKKITGKKSVLPEVHHAIVGKLGENILMVILHLKSLSWTFSTFLTVLF